MVAVGLPLTMMEALLPEPIPHKLPGVTVNVPFVAPEVNSIWFIGSKVVVGKLAPVPV